jgi:hypothetical protein
VPLTEIRAREDNGVMALGCGMLAGRYQRSPASAQGCQGHGTRLRCWVRILPACSLLVPAR